MVLADYPIALLALLVVLIVRMVRRRSAYLTSDLGETQHKRCARSRHHDRPLDSEALFRSRSRAAIVTLPFRRGWFEFRRHASWSSTTTACPHRRWSYAQDSDSPASSGLRQTDDEIAPNAREVLRPEEVRLLLRRT